MITMVNAIDSSIFVFAAKRTVFFNAVLRGWPKARKNDGANCSDATPFFLLFDSRRAADRHRVAEFEPLFKVVGTSPEREKSFRKLHDVTID